MRVLRCFIFAILRHCIPARTASISIGSKNSTSHLEIQAEVLKRDDNATILYADRPEIGLHHWTLYKKHADIEEFRILYNLTIVDSTPQDAALMPSWPQALVQYILISPPIDCGTSEQHEINGQVVFRRDLTPFIILQLIVSPFLFIAWVVAFGMTEAMPATGGWMSVLGWAMWFDLAQFYGKFAFIPLSFQWPASLALLIQRWHAGLGSVAYEVTDLHGCTPHQGLDYLQQGARSHQFRTIQTVTFSVATLFGALFLGNPHRLVKIMACLAFAELVFTVVVATKGTPMVVSGNCLLVELSPRKGFLDSEISTRWKAFSSFMGF